MFSIVIPCFNNEYTLERAARSAASQSLCDAVIIVDDGSTVELAPIVAQIQSESACDIVYIKQLNSGPGAARNRGLALVNSPWVIFLDADDTLAPNALADLKQHIDLHPSAQWLLGGVSIYQRASLSRQSPTCATPRCIQTVKTIFVG